ncbi:hypothetical protein BJ742DRAFT_779959 [Cladochytrium replicatum]|nr:hypothetical protein BJ742DRAFT_779959 [Cladochytrium replicatum]
MFPTITATSSRYNAHGVIGPMHTKLPPQIDNARRLLVKIYVEEHGWRPGNNPAHLRVENGMLMDDYDAVSIWCIVTYEGEVIGCGRFAPPIDGLLDVERYPSCPEALRKFIRENGDVLRITHGFGDAVRLMFRMHAIMTTIGDHTVQWHLKRGGVEIEGGNFKYEEQDPHEVRTVIYSGDYQPFNFTRSQQRSTENLSSLTAAL